jgi:hypothetical protein
VSVDVDRIEQMFEYSIMSPALRLDATPPQRADVRELQERIRSLESATADYPVFPVAPGLDSLFPHGGLRRGVVYDIDSSPSLLWALLAAATSSGTWCALVGMPDAGLAAAEGMGVNLDRLVLVPHPGEQWLSVVSALIDVVGIVALGPSTAPSDRVLSTVLGRLREREATILSRSGWPRTEASISVAAHRWRGLGEGHGVLHEHHISVVSRSRQSAAVRSCEMVIDAWGAHYNPGVAAVTDISRHRSAG